MNIGPLIFALLSYTVAWACWKYPKLKLHRGTPWFTTIGTFFAGFAFPLILAAGAGQANTNIGMAVLIVAAFLCGLRFAIESLAGHKYHPVRTSFIGAVGALDLAVIVADWPRVRHQGATLLPKVGKTIGRTSARIQSGQALHGQTAHQQITVLVIVGGILVAVFWFWNRMHKKRNQPVAPEPFLNEGVPINRHWLKKFFSPKRHDELGSAWEGDRAALSRTPREAPALTGGKPR